MDSLGNELDSFVINIKKLLPIIILCLFTFQCEQGWLEDIIDPTEPTIKGCNISTACNYNPDVNKFDNSCEYLSCIDCLGYPNGAAVLDSCGTCDVSLLNDCTQDCAATWGGVAVTDSCGNCSSSNIACELDCNGEWGGSAVVDACDVCDGDGLSCNDCNGDINGTAYVDGCQICVGGNTGQTACTTEADCAGVLGGTSYTDNCDTCDSDSSNDCSQDCTGAWGGSAVVDTCDVCGGDNSDCTDCLGEVGGNATVDECGTCDADSSNDCTQDCNGIWGGSAVLDNCGECGGDGSSCETIDCTDSTSDYCLDLSVLQEFIDNSQEGEYPPPSDLNPLNVGVQTWTNGRLESLCVSVGCGMAYKLSGNIPATIGSLTNLVTLNLMNNNLTGQIPSGIGNLTNLTGLFLHSNQLTGQIPSEIGNLINLEDINLRENELTGAIPSEIGNLTKLWGLSLQNNNLSGNIPSEIGNLVNLTELRLDNNQLSGGIPVEIGNLINLTLLELHWNQLTGQIPIEIGQLTNLTILYLNSNQLTGQIPIEIGNLIKLEDFSIKHNEITGEIPSEIGNLTKLYGLSLQNNNLSGEIPESICTIFTNIASAFKISNNNLCPPYPSCLTEEDIGTQDISACPVQDCAGTWGGTNFDANSDGICDDYQGTVSDIEGNTYKTIIIGTQTWMAENLKVTHYNDGSEIQYVQSESSEPDVWENLSTGAYGYYNDDPSNLDTYGNLYNWYTVDDSRGVCPEGWHVPSDNEYTILTDYLGGTSVAGGKMKEEGLDHWNSPNTGATNESGFTGLPAGIRYNFNGIYASMGGNSHFWSSSESSSGSASYLELIYDGSYVNRATSYKPYGYSIRCLGD